MNSISSEGPAEAKPARTKTNLIVDFSIFVMFLVAGAPRFTGLAIHEWLSMAFFGGVLAHLLLHWDWLAATITRFFRPMSATQRINFVLNSLLFIDVTLIALSGIMISRAVLPAFGITVTGNQAMRAIHTLSADAMLPLAGLHIAMHWQWIVSAFKRYALPARRAHALMPAGK